MYSMIRIMTRRSICETGFTGRPFLMVPLMFMASSIINGTSISGISGGYARRIGDKFDRLIGECLQENTQRSLNGSPVAQLKVVSETDDRLYQFTVTPVSTCTIILDPGNDGEEYEVARMGALVSRLCP